MASENSTTDKSAVANTPSSSTGNPVTAASTTNNKNTTVPTATASESKYSIDDFAGAFRTLEATPDVIRAALRMAGKTAFTKEEAQEIIKKYQSKEVKA